MSLAERESTAARVAASQANGKKSKGPTTPEDKARVTFNALKTGAYARSDNALREIMLRSGESPDDFEQLHLELTAEWQPEHVTQAMLVKAIDEKSLDKAQLRAALMERQLSSPTSSGQSAIATERGPADGAPVSEPRSSPSCDASSGGASSGPSGSPSSGPSSDASFAQSANSLERTLRQSLRRSLLGWLRPKNEKTGQTNLVSPLESTGTRKQT
jgi:hypothetical protein